MYAAIYKAHFFYYIHQLLNILPYVIVNCFTTLSLSYLRNKWIMQLSNTMGSSN